MVEEITLNKEPAQKLFALVLGERGLSDLIASELHFNRINAVLQYRYCSLPTPYEGDAFSDLRNLLERFKAEYEAKGSLLIHPGVSIWAERPELITLSQQLGIPVLAPTARTLTLFSDKLNLATRAEKLGVPTLIVGYEPIHSIREIETLIEESNQSFPFVLKAVRGGGSFRLLVIHSVEDLRTRVPVWLDQLRRNFGDVIIFVERYLQSARHMVVPFVRFQDGQTRIFPIVDASLQCRHRKIIEFCPAEAVEPQVLQKIKKSTAMLVESWSYLGVGVIEYLVDGNQFYFIDGLPRLDTGFHLWEKVAGTRAVAWQLSSYGVVHLEPVLDPAPSWNSAIGLRIFAEDSMLQLPQPGFIKELSPPSPVLEGQSELVWVVNEGETVALSGSGSLAYLWAGGSARADALSRVRGLVSQLWISGTLQTNERFISELLDHPWVREGIFHAGFIDEDFIPAAHPGVETLRVMASVVERASIQAAEVAQESSEKFRWAVGDQWVKPDSTLLHWMDGPHFIRSDQSDLFLFGVSGTLRLSSNQNYPPVRVLAFPIENNRWQVRMGNWFFYVRRVRPVLARLPEMKADEKKTVKLHALASGKVHSILYREGSSVAPHESMLMIESLGMLVPHAVPIDVRILRWKVSAEQVVHAGQELADLEL